MRLTCLVLLLFVSTLPAESPDSRSSGSSAPRIRDITSPEMLGAKGMGPTKPTPVTSMDELVRAFPNRAAQAAILDRVDLKKEYLLVFAWAGLADDRLDWRLEKGKDRPDVVFTYHLGKSREMVRSTRVFAIPRGYDFRPPM